MDSRFSKPLGHTTGRGDITLQPRAYSTEDSTRMKVFNYGVVAVYRHRSLCIRISLKFTEKYRF